ncbi:Zinc finger, RING-type [Sesbania bispinosa]|nr:Zinc finger, RING-type [Sesbania bispinosa]
MECSVCLTTIEEDAMIRVLPNCKHVFHVDCVDMWFSSNSTCPVCRAVVELEPMVLDTQVQVQPTAPILVEDDGVSLQDANHEVEMVGCSGLRIASFPRMVISRERSRKDQSFDESVSIEDVEKP